MNRTFLIAALLGLYWAAGAGASSASQNVCKPAYAVLEEQVKLQVGASELSFSLLVVGCEEALAAAWPPRIADLQKELAIELAEPHPVQVLFLIRERSPELRRRLTGRVNRVLGKSVVYDVFLFHAKAAE